MDRASLGFSGRELATLWWKGGGALGIGPTSPEAMNMPASVSVSPETFGYAVYVTRSVWAGVILHAANNSAAFWLAFIGNCFSCRWLVPGPDLGRLHDRLPRGPPAPGLPGAGPATGDDDPRPARRHRPDAAAPAAPRTGACSGPGAHPGPAGSGAWPAGHPRLPRADPDHVPPAGLTRPCCRRRRRRRPACVRVVTACGCGSRRSPGRSWRPGRGRPCGRSDRGRRAPGPGRRGWRRRPVRSPRSTP